MTDWPLALCDAQTVDMERDCAATDVVTRDGFTENYQIYSHPDHKWYYLNNQLASEAIIFRQTDTDERFATGKLLMSGEHGQKAFRLLNVCRSTARWISQSHVCAR